MAFRPPIALALCASMLAACSTSGPQPDGRRHEVWHAWLDSPGGELPFELILTESPAGPSATIVNGSERVKVTSTELDGERLTLRIDPYDSTIVAQLGADGHSFDGRWEKTGSGGQKTGLDFHAVAGERPRFEGSGAPLDPAAIARVDGRWAVRFASDAAPAVGVFDVDDDGTVEATFLTTTGDYRYLAGTFDDGLLRLSTFDGAHAFLFRATLDGDGTLAGDFWSRDSWHDTWTAKRDPTAVLPDAFELTRWVEGDLGRLVFPDLDGTPRALDDEAFHGRARIIEIFGSWCPNCNDATRLLVELDRAYRDDGLSILGLAFEFSGELARDAEQVRIYAEHHGIEYPLLIAGVSDKAEASRAFPLLDRIRSYPTTVFLRGDGTVRAVHQGFTGPATGEAYKDLRGRFESLVQELLAERPGSG